VTVSTVKHLLTGFLLVAVLVLAVGNAVSAQKPRTFTGIITDNVCATEGHNAMRMGPSDAECTRICVMSHGNGSFVLLEGKNVYNLSDQDAAEKLAAEKVRVVGRLDAKTKTIQVQSISALK
jgi:hypothetical protein